MNDSLLERWSATLSGLASRAAVLREDGEVARTFAEIEVEAARWTRAWGELPSGAVLAVQIGNHVSWPAVLLAARRGGWAMLPLGSHMQESERTQALELSGAAGILRLHEGEVVMERLRRDAPPMDADFLKLTSGTTSAPRLIRFTSAQLVADAEQICDTMGLTAADLNYGVIPFSHSYGFSNLLMPLLCRGIAMVAAEDRMPRAILDGLGRTGATVFPGMPTFFQALGEMVPAQPLPKLRRCISAGAPLTRAVGARFHERFGVKVHAFYGSSECGGIAYDASETLPESEGMVGKAMRGVTITPLESGQIEVRSAAVGLGYFPRAADDALNGERFIPGDLVQMKNGGLVLTGRASEIINVGGRKLNPLEVEAELAQCPGVRQIVVFGVAAGLRGEGPVACFAGEASADEVRRFAQKRLGDWQRPRDVWKLAEIPFNERGKISRRELAERYLAQTEACADKDAGTAFRAGNRKPSPPR